MRSEKAGDRVFIEDVPLMAPVFSVCQPILEVILSVKSFAALYPIQSQDCYSILLLSSHYARGDVTVTRRFQELL